MRTSNLLYRSSKSHIDDKSEYIDAQEEPPLSLNRREDKRISVPELLAPAGEWESFVAAIQSGADAVYIGGTSFSARHYAANFGEAEIRKAVEYAHIRGAKLYVTVNTLLRENELPKAADYLKFLYDSGVDGIILQDLGLMTMARELLPDLALHGSTQMTIHNLNGLKFLEKFSLKRAILSRELPLEEIEDIVNSTSAEVEVFVHGALCFSYSGQCLISSLIGGRSGNRGRCAQPCRLQYALLDGDGDEIRLDDVGSHLLSTRDLCLISHIPELIEAGVHSLKVEGRMKRPDYVATVIRIYREALDSYRADPEGFSVDKGMLNALLKAFNRGFTTAYFLGRPGIDLMSHKRPNNRGVFLGRVEKYDKNKKRVTLKLEDRLGVGDEVEIWITRGGRCTARIDDILKGDQKVQEASEGERIGIFIDGKISLDDRIFKVYDAHLAREAAEAYKSSKELKNIPISMKVHVAKGLPFTLQITDDQRNMVTASSLFLAEDAKKHPLTREVVGEHLLRLGNVPFKAEKVDVTIEGDIMVPFSEINEVRRRAIDLISQKRAEQGQPANIIDSVSFKENLEKFLSFSSFDKSRETPLLSVAVENLEGVEAALYGGADLVYISSQTNVKDIEEGAFLCEDKGVPLIIRTPRVVRGKEFYDLDELFKRVKDGLATGVNVGDLGALYLALKMGLSTYTDFSLNVFNSATIRMLGEKSVEQVTLSLELSLAQLSALAKPDGVRFEAVIHGRFPMIISEHSLLTALLDSERSRNRWFGLKDRKGFVFPVKEDEYGRTHIFNSVKTCMIQHIPELCSTNLDFVRIETWGETPSDIAELTSAYKENLLAFDASPSTYTLNDRGVRLLERLNAEGITKGHYFRGVE